MLRRAAARHPSRVGTSHRLRPAALAIVRHRAFVKLSSWKHKPRKSSPCNLRVLSPINAESSLGDLIRLLKVYRIAHWLMLHHNSKRLKRTRNIDGQTRGKWLWTDYKRPWPTVLRRVFENKSRRSGVRVNLKWILYDSDGVFVTFPNIRLRIYYDIIFNLPLVKNENLGTEQSYKYRLMFRKLECSLARHYVS